MATAPTPIPPRKHGLFRQLLRSLYRKEPAAGELVIISHSNLFYWWPVWLVGFIMAAVTHFSDTLMAPVSPGTLAARSRLVEVEADGKMQRRDVLILQEGRSLPVVKDEAGEEVVEQPHIRVTRSKNVGVLFMVVLLVVIAITNIPMRGLWSLLVILVIVMLSLIFAQLGWWDQIFAHSRLLAIHINMGGYLFIALSLFLLWLVGLLFFDRQIYVIITPGQVRVHLEIGGGETAYDAAGMVFQKRRSDLFRHWILGFGSGDLILRSANSREHIDMPNVLFVTRRVREIEERLKEKEVVTV